MNSYLFSDPRTDINSPDLEPGSFLRHFAFGMVAPRLAQRDQIAYQNDLVRRLQQLSGNGAGDGAGNENGTPNFGNIPQWWQDWYNASGKYGGVPPVQGLL